MLLTSADARVALGAANATGCFNSAGTFVSSCGQAYDGVVTLTNNPSVPLNYTKTPVSGAYSDIVSGAPVAEMAPREAVQPISAFCNSCEIGCSALPP